MSVSDLGHHHRRQSMVLLALPARLPLQGPQTVRSDGDPLRRLNQNAKRADRGKEFVTHKPEAEELDSRPYQREAHRRWPWGWRDGRMARAAHRDAAGVGRGEVVIGPP